ncbi:TetR/AcrR family transcriptional regulator C-terminal domain-containing protein [Micromonospora sp. NBC_01813]|uniref:TetR/AcrR family transcriptional regulator C-terminal domain-containing protein n=1 Tax=Micromonospora sp. NBC_01813 TaxID=2975988 RepID=UPI002DDAC2C7|nr:TetR/AcrR family transcriptional regulator C-terminal domain-containing protein [Micromonospora sp. NBC_01813]WSA08273.1 TetR/AcrR family transcriptional regulator C-terminal domain-containing protein [Micromonospora sp. NBC_01813]
MRARFTLVDIQQHALAIVDRDGLAGLTMRSLAASLQTGAMTLYNYVESREALEELVVDAVSALVEIPEPTDDWLADTRAVATSLWRTFRAHPAAIPLVLTRRTSSRASLAPAEALASALARGGLDGVDLFVAFRTVSAFVMGIAQNELAGRLSHEKDPISAAQRIGELAQGELPTLAELAPVGAAFSGQEFERGLTVILSGIKHTPRPTPSRGHAAP